MSKEGRNDPPSAGRIRQKLETRGRILRAARDLMARGEAVTVVGAAHAAGLSTATAYRYFSDPDSLKLETIVAIDLGRDGDYLADLEEQCAGLADPVERVILAHRLMIAFVRRNEPGYRLFLARGHERLARAEGAPVPPPRGGRRIPMLHLALEPVREALGPGFDDVVAALAAASGPEPHFVLKDVCRLPDPEIDRLVEGNLRLLARGLLDERCRPDAPSPAPQSSSI